MSQTVNELLAAAEALFEDLESKLADSNRILQRAKKAAAAVAALPNYTGNQPRVDSPFGTCESCDCFTNRILDGLCSDCTKNQAQKGCF